MSLFRLLIVEDDEQDLTTCRETIERYKEEKQRDIELAECRTVEEALKRLDNSFDGAIIDLKLGIQGNEGNLVVSKIKESRLRIPIAILTGTPDVADTEFTYIGIFKKGDFGAGYADLLDKFWELHVTGLIRIMGGRGVIEENLYKVFQKNILAQRDIWVKYGKENSAKTEKALLRYTLNHLIQLLDDDVDHCFPEEVYLAPPLNDKLRTGSIVERHTDHQQFVVMNPACDLVIRENGIFKTDYILLAEIEPQEIVLERALNDIQSKNKRRNKIKTIYNNNYTDYYHWLPKTPFFIGGFINFRKLLTVISGDFTNKFGTPRMQIASTFVKDVIARFSSYYARQGQPEIECENLISDITS